MPTDVEPDSPILRPVQDYGKLGEFEILPDACPDQTFQAGNSKEGA
jgi:hypothetical protein